MKAEIERLKNLVIECGGEVFFGDIALEENPDYVVSTEMPVVTACPYSETEEIKIRAVKVNEIGDLVVIGEDMDGEVIDPVEVFDIYEGDIDEISNHIYIKEETVWLRLGVTVKGTKKEIEEILENGADSGETLWNLIQSKKYEVDGETYIPASCVEDYNKENDTNFEVEDINFVF